MLTSTLQGFLILGVICYFILILIFLKNKSILLKYTLLWIVAGLVVAVLTVFPTVLSKITGFFGVASEMNGLFAACIAFIIAILMSLTSIVSRQSNKLRILTQTIAIFEKRIRELENNADIQESIKADKDKQNEI